MNTSLPLETTIFMITCPMLDSAQAELLLTCLQTVFD